MQRTANQLDLARAAGVSVSTVSRALSNSRGISLELRTQIHKLAEELGYKGRSAASGTARTVRTYVTVNAVTGGLVAFYTALVDGLVSSARAAGLALEIRLVHEQTLDAARLERDAGDAPAAATMLVGVDASPQVLSRFGTGNPLVLVNAFDPDMRFDCIAPNNYYGAVWATRLLLGAGHRSLLHVRDQLRWTTLQRHRGFLAAIDDVPGASGDILDIRDNEAGVRAAIADRKAGRTAWTGLVCVHDMAAIHLIHLLEAAGFRVPDDVSVVGFDDLPGASMLTPRLTTMRVDCQAMAREAIGLLSRRLDSPDTPAVQLECAVAPVVGGTISQISR